jgi:outer membrane murein-binding lipoprotein Lpp
LGFTALAVAAIMVLGCWLAAPAQAASQAELEAKIKRLEQGLQALKSELKHIKQAQEQQAKPLARAAKAPNWVERLTFYGDTRFRYEHTSYDDFQGTSKTGKDRFRVRLRFGVRSQIHPDVELGFRMVSGADDDPTSTNQTMGNYFAEYAKWGVDRAYVKWTPGMVTGRSLEFEFGKVPQPFLTTNTVWDGDVVPEGAFLKYTFNKGGSWQPFVLGAFMTVEQAGEFSNNVYAPALQVGARGEAGAFRFQGAAGYTSWGDLGEAGNLPPKLHGNPSYTDSSGATRLSEFRVWDLYFRGSYRYSKKGALALWGQYLRNTDASGPYQGKDTGWGAGAILSYDKFKCAVQYKNVEANASPGFIADSDSGFVNRKGWIVWSAYKLWKYGAVKVSYFSTEPEDASIPGAFNKSQTFFTDFVFKF